MTPTAALRTPRRTASTGDATSLVAGEVEVKSRRATSRPSGPRASRSSSRRSWRRPPRRARRAAAGPALVGSLPPRCARRRCRPARRSSHAALPPAAPLSLLVEGRAVGLLVGADSHVDRYLLDPRRRPARFACSRGRNSPREVGDLDLLARGAPEDVHPLGRGDSPLDHAPVTGVHLATPLLHEGPPRDPVAALFHCPCRRPTPRRSGRSVAARQASPRR